MLQILVGYPRGWRVLTHGLALLLALSFAASCHAAPGLYALHSARQPFDPAVMDQTFVHGVALQVGWREVEPMENEYDWRKIEEVLRAAKFRHKHVTVHLMPMFPPQWVYQAGVEPFSYQIVNPRNPNAGRTFTQYVPWDPVFLQKWAKLVRQFGKQFANDATLSAVSVAAPVPEMGLYGAFPGSETAQKWAAIYKRDAYMRAWRLMVDEYGQAFPKQTKFIAPGLVLEDAGFADEVLAYASQRFGDRLWAFGAGLNAAMRPGSQGLGLIYSMLERHGKQSRLGFQMVWSATNDDKNRLRGSLREATKAGRRMGASYIEIYEIDVRNAALESELSDLASALQPK